MKKIIILMFIFFWIFIINITNWWYYSQEDFEEIKWSYKSNLYEGIDDVTVEELYWTQINKEIEQLNNNINNSIIIYKKYNDRTEEQLNNWINEYLDRIKILKEIQKEYLWKDVEYIKADMKKWRKTLTDIYEEKYRPLLEDKLKKLNYKKLHDILVKLGEKMSIELEKNKSSQVKREKVAAQFLALQRIVQEIMSEKWELDGILD